MLPILRPKIKLSIELDALFSKDKSDFIDDNSCFKSSNITKFWHESLSKNQPQNLISQSLIDSQNGHTEPGFL